MGKYVKYAIGEIILVVIGILIALQINSWNQQRLNLKKEHSYLTELKASLETDKIQTQQVLEFNVEKDSIVLELMRIFDASLTNEERFVIIQTYTTPFTNYQIFKPNRTTWTNFLAAENINLIQDKSLREGLTAYYSFDYEGSVQERIKIMNRKIIDENFPKFFTRELALKFTNMNTELPTIAEFDLHKNQVLLSDLFGLRYLINLQNEAIATTIEKIDTLIQRIDKNM